MKKKKFSIEVIEEGRLTNDEKCKVNGGVSSVSNTLARSYTDSYICESVFSIVECYSFLTCARGNNNGDRGYLNCGGPNDPFLTCPGVHTEKY